MTATDIERLDGDMERAPARYKVPYDVTDPKRPHGNFVNTWPIRPDLVERLTLILREVKAIPAGAIVVDPAVVVRENDNDLEWFKTEGDLGVSVWRSPFGPIAYALPDLPSQVTPWPSNPEELPEVLIHAAGVLRDMAQLIMAAAKFQMEND